MSASNSENDHFSDEGVPEKKELFRWKRANPSSWKVNVAKHNRSKRLPYITKSGLKAPKISKSVDCSKCRFKCQEHFTESDRQNICKFYWGMDDYKRQKDFILKFVKTLKPKRQAGRRGNKLRSEPRLYYLADTQKTKWRVCANFFRKTLCISNGPVNTALGSQNFLGFFDGTDKRGNKVPGNKTNIETLSLVKRHIEKFHTVPAHYVRKSSKRRYLDSNLSIRKMHALYLTYCKSHKNKPVKASFYRYVFCTQYNLSFHKPKKDQCTACTRYNLTDKKNKSEIEKEYQLHIMRKDDCYAAKKLDKERSLKENSFQSVTFDLQSVLNLPSSKASPMFYSRKLNVFNLTIYENGHNKDAYCFLWNELNGKRGSSEIGSILLKYISSLPRIITELSLISDTCGGQNRNQHIAAVLLYAVQYTHLITIEQKFLESGHTFMECDSMHTAIENYKRNRSVFTMNGWLKICRNARSSKKPYIVNELKFTDFYDLKELTEAVIRNRNIDEHGNKVSWLKVKSLRYRKDMPNVILYRYKHTDPFKKLIVSRQNPGLQLRLTKAYSNTLPISKAKKKDLLKLCKEGVIPKKRHKWFDSLPTSERANDSCEESQNDSSDESDDSETDTTMQYLSSEDKEGPTSSEDLNYQFEDSDATGHSSERSSDPLAI